MWTSHTYLSCTKAPVILIMGAWRTERKPLKKANPRGWIVCDHSQVIVNPPAELLDQYIRTKQVFYDKHKIEFNVNEGMHLLFDEAGCFLLKELAT